MRWTKTIKSEFDKLAMKRHTRFSAEYMSVGTPTHPADEAIEKEARGVHQEDLVNGSYLFSPLFHSS